MAGTPRATKSARPRAVRADAQRNIDAILRAAEECLAQDPETSVAEIARTAGVGRVTLYGHFPTRAALVEAVFAQVLTDSGQTLGTLDTGGDPTAALRRLVAASWRIVHRFSAILAAAERELPAEMVHNHHAEHLERISAVLERGRDTGAFRRDVPLPWLATVCMTLMHTAAREVDAGRLAEHDAEHTVVSTILGACR